MKITDWDQERLKMTMNMPSSCSVQALRAYPGIPSIPVALQVLT